MKSLPTIETTRLRLRPYTLADAPQVKQYAGAKEIAATTFHIPHPYPDGAAEEYIRKREDAWHEGKALTLAIDVRESGDYVGGIDLVIGAEHYNAEIGYWIAVPYWGRGYASEATAAIVRFGFDELDLNRIHGHCFGNNPASGRVLEKCGMKQEGILRDHVFKWDEFHDVIQYAILRCEYDANHRNHDSSQLAQSS